MYPQLLDLSRWFAAVPGRAAATGPRLRLLRKTKRRPKGGGVSKAAVSCRWLTSRPPGENRARLATEKDSTILEPLPIGSSHVPAVRVERKRRGLGLEQSLSLDPWPL